MPSPPIEAPRRPSIACSVLAARFGVGFMPRVNRSRSLAAASVGGRANDADAESAKLDASLALALCLFVGSS